MVRHLNVVVRDSELQEFIDRVDQYSDWVVVDLEVRSSFHFIYQKVLTWNVLLEFEYETEEELNAADLDYTK